MLRSFLCIKFAIFFCQRSDTSVRFDRFVKNEPLPQTQRRYIGMTLSLATSFTIHAWIQIFVQGWGLGSERFMFSGGGGRMRGLYFNNITICKFYEIWNVQGVHTPLPPAPRSAHIHFPFLYSRRSQGYRFPDLDHRLEKQEKNYTQYTIYVIGVKELKNHIVGFISTGRRGGGRSGLRCKLYCFCLN